MAQNKHRPSDPSFVPKPKPPPSKQTKPKPIAKKQNHLQRFGSYFSKSPKFTTNRLSSASLSSSSSKSISKHKKHNEEKEAPLHRFTDKYLSATNKRQTSTEIAPGHLSNSIDSNSTSNSQTNSMEGDTRSMNGVYFPENKITNTNNSRYRELIKEYVDTESTLSSSDIDDISSIASDEPVRSNSYINKRPPRIAPPPPPHARPPPLPIPRRNSQHTKSKSLNSTPIAHNKARVIPSRINTKHTKSSRSNKASTPNSRQYKGRKRSQIKLSPTELTNNPYINAVDFGFATIKVHKKRIALPPPPLSPSHNAKHNRSRRNSFKSYRSRNMQQDVKKNKKALPTLHKSHSVNIKKEKKKRHVSEDITQTQFKGNNNNNNNNRMLRSSSMRLVDDLSLSEKIYQNRRTVLHRLRGKNKKDVMSKLDISIGKVEEKLKVYVRNLVSLQEEKCKLNEDMKHELNEWENINNFSLTNLCRSYYSNYGLLIEIRIEIARKYCECFRDKYRQLKKTRDRIKKDAKKFSLDDLVLTVEAAMMSASNIRLPSDINNMRENEGALKSVISELKKKYGEKKYEDIVAPMSKQDRTKHILTMLVQIIDTSNQTKTSNTQNVSDGLPYFHPKDNGYQVPFEQLLYDPRFAQKKSIDEFRARYIDVDKNEVNTRIIDKENLSLTKISTFIYRLTNSFLDSCELNRDSPFFQKLFWDCTNLMIGRSIFPQFNSVIKYVISRDAKSVELDAKYAQQTMWMRKLKQKTIGIEDEFVFKPIKASSVNTKNTFFSNIEAENESTIAYYRAIKRLKKLYDIAVPQDSIVLVIDTMHDIQKCAIKYSKMNCRKENVIISGDSLFPIVVYCLVQSNVNYWNRWMFMMTKFYTTKILSFGQTGFCFSLINAAVSYILDQKVENFKS